MRRILNMGGAGSSQPGVTPWRDDSMFVRQESHDGSMGQQAPAAPSDYGSGSSGGSRGRRGPGQGQGQPPYPAADRYEGAGVSPANSAYGHVKQRPSRSSPAERNRPAGLTAAATPYPSYGEVHQEPPEHSNPFVAAVLGSGSTRGGHFQHQPSPPPPPPPLSQVPPPQQRPAQAEQLYYDDIATADGPRTLPSRVRTGAGDGQPAWSDDGTKAMKRDSSFPNPFGSGQAAQTSPMPAAATPAPTGEAATAADAHYMLSRRASKGHADGGVQRFRSLKRAGSRSNHQHRDAPVAGNDSSLETFEHQRQYQQQQQYPGEEGVARLPRRRSSKSQTLPSHGSTDAELVQQEYLRQSQLQQQHALHQGQGQGYAPPDDVERPMNRYVDVLQPPSVQQKDSGAGMDKIKNKLFGGLNSRRKELQMDHHQGHSHSQRDAPGNGASFSLRPRSQDFGATAASAASAPQGAQGETKKEGWFGKRDKDKAAKASPAPGVVPTSEANVTSRIGWLCATQAQAWDWGYLLHLCDSLSHSEASSKEAARALRKELKYGEEKPRMRAIKVWAVLCLNASDRFKLQVAQKRFLEVCEEMATSSKTPPAVKDMMFDVWSMLAYLFKSDVELQSITRSYNKIRPDGWPLDGRPLDPDHPVFNPASTSLYQPNQARPSDFQRVELAPGVRASPIPSSHEHDRLMRAPDGTMVNAPARGVGGGGDDGFAGINEARDYEWEMEQEREREREWEREREREREEAARNAREQCEDARRSAQLLAETLVNHGLHSEELAMLSARAQEAQDTILSLLPWVSAAAERSRDALVEQHRANAADGRPHIPVDKTRDEMLLDDVLDAHEKLSTASGMVEEARNKAREDDEERRVLDQSMREQRMDRSNLVQDPTTGQYYSLSQGEGAHHSSSTNAGAASVQAPPPPARRSQQQQQAAPLDVSRASTHVRAPSSTSHLSHTTAREGNIDDQALQQSRLTRGPRPLPSVDNLTSSFASGVPLHLQTSSSNSASAPPSSFSAPHASSAHGHANVAGANASPNKDDNESVILTPIEPSEKALGKRRAVSVDEDTLAVPNGLGQQGATLAAQAQAMQLSSSNMSSQTQTDERASSHGHSHNHSQSHSHSHEEALRARPPPAIPGAPPPVAACATGTVPLATPMNGADLPRQQGQGRAGVPDTTNNPFYDPAYKHHFPQYQQPPSQ